jgi:hypothetical protein
VVVAVVAVVAVAVAVVLLDEEGVLILKIQMMVENFVYWGRNSNYFPVEFLPI